MRFRIFLLGLFFVPLAAHAEDSTVWNFQNADALKVWNVQGISVQPTAEGFHITGQGGMIRATLLAHPIDVIELTFARSQATTIALLWHVPGAPQQALVQVPIVLSGGSQPETVTVNMGRYQKWSRNADLLGLGFPEGTDLVLQDMTMRGWSLSEKILEAWRSFWTFDEEKAYSINFLWGPLLVTNPVAREQLFSTLPPFGRSANSIFYGIIILAGLVIASLAAYRRMRLRDGARHRTCILAFLGVVASVWLVYDVRMGSEILSYAARDYRTYVSQPPGNRTLRNLENFYDVVERSMPLLTLDPHYVIIVPKGIEHLATVALSMTYPSVPLFPEEKPGPEIHAWLIFRRGDIRVDDHGQLVQGSTVLSPPGRIVTQFDQTSFLFRPIDAIVRRPMGAGTDAACGVSTIHPQ
ncbi:hypothetical protein HY213_05560 [Candidatus Peregrinibacteria bacterium]|nr:hypothetical protein [Candidatus Peregrinibacteria bacterium]